MTRDVGWPYRPPPSGSRRIAKAGIAEREAALLRAPLFASLPKRAVRRIARESGVSEYGEGATVVREGVLGDVFFVILEGGAHVVRKGRRIAGLKAGEFFGEMALLAGEPRMASVVTAKPSRLLSLSGRAFRSVVDDTPGLATKVMGELARRVRENERKPAG